jgi:molybdopterin/thiamine biosynthesis adenylyltransferase
MFNNRDYSRQSFLGEKAQQIFKNASIAVIGLGGGGSHIAQQLAHIGFENIILFDEDRISNSNLNRLVGGTYYDCILQTRKVNIAKRGIQRISPFAKVVISSRRWQECPSLLKSADIVIGCVDSFQQRRELEIFCRRFLIPYIDIGMDVYLLPNYPPRMAGQVIVSIPGGPCMQCFNYINDENLAKEARRYSQSDPSPQVIWANGILASTAVGLMVDFLTNWTCKEKYILFYSFDGNDFIMREHPKGFHLKNNSCVHFPIENIGQPKSTKL